jgi:E3 ubiquitin-protein ligase UBR4
MVQMLGRFASNTSFSVDSKGGGRESNSRLLPFMLQMACHLLDQGEASQYRVQAKTLAATLSSTAMSDSNEGGLGFKPSTPTTPQRGASEESVQFMMVQSLLLLSLDDWLCHRRTFLQRGLAHSYAQYKQGQLGIPSPKTYLDFSSVKASPAAESKALDGQCYESKNSALSQEHLFKVIQPMLVYVGLVEQTQRFLKSSSSKAREVEAKMMDECKEEGAATRIGIESWEVTMKERVRDVSTMLVFAKEILEWVEEMQGASDVQEALDIMGVLGDVLSGSCTSCEDFVRNAIAGR